MWLRGAEVRGGPRRGRSFQLCRSPVHQQRSITIIKQAEAVNYSWLRRHFLSPLRLLLQRQKLQLAAAATTCLRPAAWQNLLGLTKSRRILLSLLFSLWYVNAFDGWLSGDAAPVLSQSPSRCTKSQKIDNKNKGPAGCQSLWF